LVSGEVSDEAAAGGGPGRVDGANATLAGQNAVVRQRRRLRAYDLNGNAWADLNGSGSLTTRRLYLDAVDALFARIDSGGNTAWYLDDHLGSIRDLMNNSGSIIDHIDYSAFGAVSYENSSTNGDRYKFAAREFDSELSGASLAYYRGRYYRFDVGMWQSQDPLRFGAGDSNLYRYAGNGASNFTDPSGLDPTFTMSDVRRNPAVGMLLGLSNCGYAPRAQWARDALNCLDLTLPMQLGMQQVVNEIGPMPMPARQRMSVGQWFSWYFSPIPSYVIHNPGEAIVNFVQGGNQGGRDVFYGFYQAGQQTLYAITHPRETLQNISNLTHALVDDFPGTISNIWNNMATALHENPSQFMGGVAWNALWAGGTMQSVQSIGSGLSAGGSASGGAAALTVSVSGTIVLEGSAATAGVLGLAGGPVYSIGNGSGPNGNGTHEPNDPLGREIAWYEDWLEATAADLNSAWQEFESLVEAGLGADAFELSEVIAQVQAEFNSALEYYEWLMSLR
jgi:RHS repeat-associated protein